jgi:hypothetical protein
LVCDVDEDCVRYGALVVDEATGMLSSFSIDGISLAGRVAGDGPSGEVDGIQARVGSAYRSNGGEVTIVVVIENESDVAVQPFGFAATYQPTNAVSSIEANGAWGADTIAAGASGEQLIAFAGGEIGGLLRISALRTDGLDIGMALTVPSSRSVEIG